MEMKKAETREPDMVDLVNNPRFVAVWIAIWVCLLLAMENIVTKANLLLELG